MKKIITLTALYFVLLFGASSVCGQSYVRLSQASGVETDANQAELTTAAQAIVDALPAEFQDKFKVYDIGFYVYNELMNGGLPSVWKHAINTASAQSDYYLLFGKETDASGVYNTFYVDLKLPDTGVFECMDEVYYEIIKTSVEKPLNTIHVNNASPQKYYEAELVAMQNLKAYISKLANCCENGEISSSCGSCLINSTEIETYLEGIGFLQFNQNFSASITPYSGYADLQSNVKIELTKADGTLEKITDDLDDFLSDLGQEVVTQGKVSVFDDLTCQDFLAFTPLNVSGYGFTEEIVALSFNGSIVVYYRSNYGGDANSLQEVLKGTDGSRQVSSFVGKALGWFFKRAASSPASAVPAIIADYCIAALIEYWFDPHEKYNDGDYITALGDEVVRRGFVGAGATVASNLINSPAARFGEALITYATQTPYAQWDFMTAMKQTLTGVILDIFASPAVVQRIKLLPKFVGDLKTQDGLLLIPKYLTDRFYIKVWKEANKFPTLRTNKNAIEDFKEALLCNLSLTGAGTGSSSKSSSNCYENLENTVEDAVEEAGSTLWNVIKKYFVRGYKFNNRGVDKYSRIRCEITLINGNRVDTYIPAAESASGVGMIIERKATDIDKIKRSTFISYVNSIKSKYASGNFINTTTVSNKNLPTNKLEGEYYLEIPKSNEVSALFQEYKNLAQSLGVKLITLAE